MATSNLFHSVSCSSLYSGSTLAPLRRSSGSHASHSCNPPTIGTMNTANDQHQTIHHNLTSNAAKQLLKGERRYPCGFPGCKWVFTRSNHVLRHHQRVHPGFKPSESPKSEAYSLPALAATISSSSFASRDAVNHSATAFSNGGSGLVGGGGGLGSAGVSSSSSGGSGFKCDFPGCDQAFKTLTLLTRHKRYVHLMIAIQEQMSYIASSNGFHPRLSTPKPYVYENPKSVDNNASLLKRDHLASRHHSQQQLHQAFPSIHSSHLSLTNLGSGQHALQLLSCSSPESEDECDDEPMSELEPEVVLQVDESQEWVPDNGTIHLVPKTSNSVGDFQALRAVAAAASSAIVRVEEHEDDEDDEEMGNGSDDDESRADFNSSDSFSRHHPVASSLLQVHSVHSGSEADDSSTADHKQKRPYVCDVPGCDKSYTKHSHLVRHKVETHKMQKPEPKQRGAGTNFIPPPPINLVDRPYVCDYPGCRWSFKRQYHLDRHYMTHRLSLPKSDGEGSLDSSSAGGKLIIDSGFTDEDNDCGLSSPNMAASSTKRKYSCPESKGFSLLLSPDSASPKTETVPTKFNWPQLLKEKLFPCEHPNCDLRFKNQAMADQHYRMTHSGSSSSNNGFAIKQEPLDAMTLQSQLQRVIALTALGQQRSSPTLPGESLLKKTRTEKGLDLSEQANFSSFTQLKLLQALTRGSANNNQSPKFPAQTSNIHVSLDGQEEEETHITGSSDNLVDDENELLVRNSSWIAKQRKPREKGIFPCDIPGCDKKFGRNCELTRHKLNHMDIWPFSCDWPGCGRKFKRKDVFKNHQRTHRKEEDGTSIGQDEEVDDEPNESCNTNIESKTSSLQDERLGRCNQVLIEGDVDEDGDISDKE